MGEVVTGELPDCCRLLEADGLPEDTIWNLTRVMDGAELMAVRSWDVTGHCLQWRQEMGLVAFRAGSWHGLNIHVSHPSARNLAC